MVSKTAWDNEMKSFSWRIDAYSQARHVPQLNSSCAIAELQLGPHGKPVRKYTQAYSIVLTMMQLLDAK